MLSNGEDPILAAVRVMSIAAVFGVGVGVCHARLFVHAKVPTHIALDREPAPTSFVWALES